MVQLRSCIGSVEDQLRVDLESLGLGYNSRPHMHIVENSMQGHRTGLVPVADRQMNWLDFQLVQLPMYDLVRMNSLAVDPLASWDLLLTLMRDHTNRTSVDLDRER
jgi:hypothetical protein